MLADWQDVWHSPQPPVTRDLAISLVVMVVILFIVHFLLKYRNLTLSLDSFHVRIPLYFWHVNEAVFTEPPA